MRAASWDCHRSVLRNDTHAGRTLDPTARSEPIRCGKEDIAFRCRLKAAVPCGKKLWTSRTGGFCSRRRTGRLGDGILYAIDDRSKLRVREKPALLDT